MSQLHPKIAVAYELMALVRKAPREVPRLHELTGIKEATIWRHIEAMRGEGLIYRSGFSATGAHQFTWQPSIGEMRDVEQRAPPRGWSKKRLLEWLAGHPVVDYGGA